LILKKDEFLEGGSKDEDGFKNINVSGLVSDASSIKRLKDVFTNTNLYVSQISLSDTLKNFAKGRVCFIFTPWEYNIANENINVGSFKSISISEMNNNRPIVNILSNVFINC